MCQMTRKSTDTDPSKSTREAARKDQDSTGCGRTFIKIMIVELSWQQAEFFSKYQVQQLFNQ